MSALVNSEITLYKSYAFSTKYYPGECIGTPTAVAG